MRVRFHATLGEFEAREWNALLPDDNPFVDHRFLIGLERCGCVGSRSGWYPHHLGIYDGERLVAAAPLYLKDNSHGEFVFDWSWASAYERHGLAYYPKLLCAVPYSPVTGPRLLVGKPSGTTAVALQKILIDAIRGETERLDLSSAHLNFATAADSVAFSGTNWLPRQDWQFHWHNRGWRDFDEFLSALNHKKRKNIRHERARAASTGVECEIRVGDELDETDWRTLHAFYLATFDAKGNYPALTLEFFRYLGATMPRQVVAVMCRRRRRTIAAALCLRSATTLYGRYWGCHEQVEGLHFEACYYQGIEYCLREGLAHFEPGAQGEHKIARGFLPERTCSFHWVADPRFRAAIAIALQQESTVLDAYRNEVLAHSPYVEGKTRASAPAIGDVS